MNRTSKILIAIILAAIVGLSCFFIFSQPEPPEEITAYFNEFLYAYTTSSFEEFDSYLHYEYPQYRILMEEIYANLHSHRIEKWEKINDKLWLAHAYIANSNEPDGSVNQYFIGEVDGSLRVMIGVYQVPEELASQERLSRYLPEGVLPADVIFDTDPAYTLPEN